MSRAPHGADRAAAWSSAVAVAAAVVVAMLVNVLAARHYERWDWTREGRFTLATTTGELLRGLGEPLEILVLTSTADPLTLTIRHLLTAFGAHTSQLDVRFVDPDRQPAEFLAAERRYGTLREADPESEPELDAAIAVGRGARRHLIPYALLSPDSATVDQAAERRIEHALVAAIRQVLGPTARPLCFTVGHGEDSLSDYGPQGVGALGERLRASNHEVVDLVPRRPSDGDDPVARCALVVVAGPKEPFDEGDVARLVRYLEAGGSVLVALGPVPDTGTERMVDVGLGPLFAAGNMRLTSEIVFERDPDRRAVHGLGESFFAEPLVHGATEAVRRATRSTSGVYLEVAGALDSDPSAPLPAAALLRSSGRSFAMRDFFAWARAPAAPEPGEQDRRGPLVLARAVELAAPAAGSPRRPRMVAVAASSVLRGASFQLPELRPNARFVEGLFGWLTAEPLAFADGAADDEPTSAPRLTEEALSAALRYALGYVPLGIVLLGVAVAVRRRSRPGPRAVRPAARPPADPPTEEPE